jgi:hypothetical protein
MVIDQLEPIRVLVSSWKKMEFGSWPALLDEVQDQYEINAGKVNHGYAYLRGLNVIQCNCLGKTLNICRGLGERTAINANYYSHLIPRKTNVEAN